MTIESQLMTRSAGCCELCTATDNLCPYDVKPNPKPSLETQVLLCKNCLDRLDSPSAGDAKQWYGLTESMWSEEAAVKILVYRILKSLGDNTWARELLSQLYLDEDTQAWADAGLNAPGEAIAKVLDSNGTTLFEGDTVTLIKDLEVKGANFIAKRGTLVKNISLTNDPKFIEGKVNGTRIVLVAAYLKKA